MTRLNLKATSKPVKQYFAMMGEKRQMGLQAEGNVAPAFADLLGYCARQAGYTFNEQHPLKLPNNRSIRLDGAVLTRFNLRYGAWEAKDSQDDLRAEIRRKFEAGYPRDNILFQSPDQAILFQDGREVLAAHLDAEKPQALVDILQAFFSYSKPAYDEWEQAVEEFKRHVKDVAEGLDALIEREYTRSLAYKQAFDRFFDLCRSAINPNLSKDAVEEMLIQHILTERIFRRVFQNERFTRQNAIAREIETVVDALTGKHFNRDDFMRELDHFYGAIETTAATITDYNEKQDFLNTVYEQFFQGFSVKVADTHGIVYTPQPIVQFMVRSVEELLRREFNRSLADPGVHILDPFVGTGNFILRVMEEIRRSKPSALPHKYAHELHCNEVMLLPYYIASMNIEHAYYEAVGEYAPFEGICLVDTFDLAEERQMRLFTEANTQRVERQRQTDLTVILGNPPYNVGQINENDNNKNRIYKVLDRRVQETYSRASAATNRNALSDPYVKAFRWASDRIRDEGIVAFVSNNSFIDNIAFDGMRQHLLADFDAVYVLDLGGNVRKNPKLSGTTHNVFGIQVGVCISFLVRRGPADGRARAGALYYARMDEFWRRGQKYTQLDGWGALGKVDWQTLTPVNNVWLTEGLQTDWDALLPLGTKDAKAGRGQAIFEVYSRGAETTRDAWVYNFNLSELDENITRFIETYNTEVDRWRNRAKLTARLDDFVLSDEKRIKWSSRLKECLVRGQKAIYQFSNFRTSLYRPFTKQHLYFDEVLTHRQGQFPRIFPTPETERENRVICVSSIGHRAPFTVLMTNLIPNLTINSTDGFQCFPLYTYEPHPPSLSPQGGAPPHPTLSPQGGAPPHPTLSPQGGEGLNSPSLREAWGKGPGDGGRTVRRDNISDWALAQYRQHYGDETITKEDIFYYIYALLHHPEYRTRYAANLKRELPRVPFVNSLPTPVGEGAGGWGDKWDISPEMAARMHQIARKLRNESTPAERYLWQFLRREQVDGRKFRRQMAIGPFVVDFYCPSERLAVEVDGPIHDTQQEADRERQSLIESLGIRFVRFTNEQVFRDIDGVIKAIRGAFQAPHPQPPSLHVGEGPGMGGSPLPTPVGEGPGMGGSPLPTPVGEGPGMGETFHAFAAIGRALAELHLNYESLPEYPLRRVENPAVPPSLRVEKMALSRDKTALRVNDFLTLEGIPPEAYAYKLGSRSALEWVIEQYRVTTDPRSGITNDPNRLDDEGYIVRLIGQVIHVSLETLKRVAQIAAYPIA